MTYREPVDREPVDRGILRGPDDSEGNRGHGGWWVIGWLDGGSTFERQGGFRRKKKEARHPLIGPERSTNTN
jgi:hypothetical protein